MSQEKKTINVTFDGKVVGVAKVDEDTGIAEFEIEASDLKHILPDYDPSEGLSIGEVQDQIMDHYRESDVSIMEAYFDSKRESDETPEQRLSSYLGSFKFDMKDLEATYYKNRPKGTFDA